MRASSSRRGSCCSAQATEKSGPEMRDKLTALENQAEQSRTSHYESLLNEMNNVAGVALEIQ